MPPVPTVTPFDRTTAWAVTVLAMAGALTLLFVRLGHYALWDDEAITVMTAEAVGRTGDTSAWVPEHNLIAYRDGLLIRHFADRYTPPLQFYLMAPVLRLLGDSNFVCRLPFAVCGLGTVLLLLRWMWRVRPPPLLWWALLVALLSNVEFFLFFRQARYYGLGTLLTTAVAFCYGTMGWRRRSVGLLSLLLALLFTAQYLDYVAVAGCLLVDHVVWGRYRRRFDLLDWTLLLLPQVIVVGVVGSIWNPLLAAARAPAAYAWPVTHARLFWMSWRDLIASDFVIVPLLLICPLLYFVRKQAVLLRLPLALLVFVSVMAIAANSPVTPGADAEVRYFAPVTVLCIAIAVVAVGGTLPLKPVSRWALLVWAGLSTIVTTAPDKSGLAFGASIISFVHELIVPQQDPYTPTIAWLNAHVPAGSTVLVSPPWMAYPLMVRTPQLTYAWQLSDPPTRPEFRNLPAIHFARRVAPDYLIAFGPYTHDIGQVRTDLARRGVHYAPVGTIPVYWKDRYRPERIWRDFKPRVPGPGEEIYLFSQVKRQ